MASRSCVLMPFYAVISGISPNDTGHVNHCRAAPDRMVRQCTELHQFERQEASPDFSGLNAKGFMTHSTYHQNNFSVLNAKRLITERTIRKRNTIYNGKNTQP